MKNLLHILIFILPLPAFAGWDFAASMLTPREGMAVVELDGKIYTIGGKDQPGYSALGIMEIYDPVQDEWSSGPSLIHPRFLAAGAAHDGKIFVFGGRNGNSILHSSEMYDPATGVWEDMGGIMMPRREGAAAITRGDSILVIAGKMQMMYSAHTSVFDPASYDWDNNMGFCPNARAGHAAVSIGDDIYIIGGVYFGMMPDVSILSGNSWTSGPDLPIALGNVSGAAAGQNIFVIGGNTGTEVTNIVLEFSATEGAWSEFDPIIEARENHGVIALDNVIYVIGGGRESLGGREFLGSVEVCDMNNSVVPPDEVRTELKTFTISNYPNPFSDRTNIMITTALPGDVNEPVIIYNILGREVMRWSYPVWNSGQTVLNWNGIDYSGRHVPSGVYFVRIDAEGFNETRKISIVR
ncbi:MAG: T9SS type A sorting domain-containing protein [FCB group bacterium]|nr:T9SS type A sorting domain-containing protein [FCB group bacterium]